MQLFCLLMNFFLFLCCKVSSSTKRNNKSDLGNKVAQLDSLINSYILQHSVERLQKSENTICDRKFVIGTYYCPQQIGNRMNEFLNHFFAAIVTNRTLVWDFCDRSYCDNKDEKSCDQFLTRLPWIPSLSEVKNRMSNNSCVANKTEILVHSTNDYSLGCCKLDLIKEILISFGVLGKFIALQLIT